MKNVNCLGQEQKRHTYSLRHGGRRRGPHGAAPAVLGQGVPSPYAHMLNMATETTSMKFVMKSVGLAGRKLVGSHASDSRMNVVHDTKMVTITTTEISLAQAGFSLKSGFSKVWKTFHRKEPMYFEPAAGSRVVHGARRGANDLDG